jgi:hypothetical protein
LDYPARSTREFNSSSFNARHQAAISGAGTAGAALDVAFALDVALALDAAFVPAFATKLAGSSDCGTR